VIIGIGCVASDDVLVTSTTWVAGKGRVLQREVRLGGNVRTALAAAASLGLKTAYLGTLGGDTRWSYVLDDFRARGVALDFVDFSDDVHPVLSTVIVTSDGERYIAFDDDVLTRTPLPPETTVAAALAIAELLIIDATTAPPGSLDVLTRARATGIPIVLDAERHAPGSTLVTDLLALADHPVLPAAFAMDVTGSGDVRDAVEALWSRGYSSVVVTDGVHGVYARDAQTGGVVHVSAFPVVARDTNGCGDTFHGAYAVALLEGATLLDRVRFASAAAAVVAQRQVGGSRVPTLGEVQAMMA